MGDIEIADFRCSLISFVRVR